MVFRFFLVMISAASIAAGPTTTANLLGIAVSQETFQPTADDLVKVGTWPAIGKWMLDRFLRPANWFGSHVQSKTLREPINIVLVDAVSSSQAQSIERLLRACEAAGYPPREGHSGGYCGLIGGELFPQLPARRGHAFSSEPFEFHNNHGRIFGPFKCAEGWLFTGSFSREKFRPLSGAEHLFISFSPARDDFARRLDAKTDFKREGYVELGNALADHPLLTTADHDGRAAVLKALPSPRRGPRGIDRSVTGDPALK